MRARSRPESGAPRSCCLRREQSPTADVRLRSRTTAWRGRLVPGPVEVTRDTAWATLTRYTQSESLLRHALAVEAAADVSARRYGVDAQLCGRVAVGDHSASE